MSGKPEEHHHTCSEAKDHHCPECCPCKCCSRHSRTYHTWRAPLYPWEKDYNKKTGAEEWRRWRELDERAQFSPSGLDQAIEASLRDPSKRKKREKKIPLVKKQHFLLECPKCNKPRVRIWEKGLWREKDSSWAPRCGGCGHRF